MTIYNHLMHALPKEESNIRKVLLKTTMGTPVVVGGKKEKE
jgi:ribosomal protein L1